MVYRPLRISIPISVEEHENFTILFPRGLIVKVLGEVFNKIVQEARTKNPDKVVDFLSENKWSFKIGPETKKSTRSKSRRTGGRGTRGSSKTDKTRQEDNKENSIPPESERQEE